MTAPATPGTAPAAPGGPLSANRNYRLLWTSQMLSEFGFNSSAIAFPLLVLAVTGSAAASGLVLGTIAAAQLAAGLPAGALVDRWDRKKIMLACEAAQALAAASLVAALVTGVASIAHMVAVAAVVGVCAALFEPAEEASLPNLVATDQVATAVAMNSARSSLGHLSGTAAGGFLFAAGRAVPFLADAVMHAVACAALAFVRVPSRPAERQPVSRLAGEMAEGLRWVWGHRPIRVTAACAVVLNLFFSAFYIVVIVLARGRGVPAGQIGLMAAMLGAGGVAGALVAPYLTRVVSPYLSIAGAFWVLAVLTPLAVFATNGYVMGALFAGMALLPPTANTTIMARQLLLTPDELRGRLGGVLGLVTGVAAAAGPALGGLLTQAVSGRHAVLFCAAGIAATTLAVTISPTLRHFPADSPAAETAGRRLADGPRSAMYRFFPTEGEHPMDENAKYEVLRNDEEQYSLWLAGKEVPAGWHQVGKEGTLSECETYVDEVWKDMRPRSLREQMERDERDRGGRNGELDKAPSA